MNALSSLPSRFCLLPLALACCLPLSSCHSTKSTDGQYASYNGNDGHYNPYPAGSKPNYKYQQYNESPPPPVYNGGSSDEDTPKKKGKKSTHSSSGTSKSGSKSGTKSGTKSGSKSGTSKSGTSKGKSSKSKSKNGSGSGSGSTHKSSSSSSSGSYTVKSNDTLYGIAKKHHTTVSKIKNLNGLSSDTIHGGQKLKLP